jgi:hypothetical protein
VLLPEFVPADEYVVFVPSAEIPTFERITDPRIKICAQETLGSEYAVALEDCLVSVGNQARYGWYLQQFFKIEALLKSNADLVAIWDADCVPAEHIQLFGENNKPIYMTAKEYHEPYFQMIERLLGLKRVQIHSFVIPGFPILSTWVKEFIAEIEKRNKTQWHAAIINHTDLSLQSGFSETETLGSWVVNRKPGEWDTQDVTWERRGQSRFGPARDFSISDVKSFGKKNNLRIITFENWDNKQIVQMPKNIILSAKMLLKKLVTQKRFFWK